MNSKAIPRQKIGRSGERAQVFPQTIGRGITQEGLNCSMRTFPHWNSARKQPSSF
jgi:hypothetical protein